MNVHARRTVVVEEDGEHTDRDGDAPLDSSWMNRRGATASSNLGHELRMRKLGRRTPLRLQ
jgi:hypothetical protein